MKKRGIRMPGSKAHIHIHKTLRKHYPATIHSAKNLVAFKYPKLFFLAATILLSYFIFSMTEVKEIVFSLQPLSYINDFVAGVLFSFGFTTSFSVGYFVSFVPANIFLATIIAGIGSTVGDMLIFRVIKFSFIDEFKELEKKKVIRKIEKIVKNNKHVLIRHYLIYIFAGIILATPLPDEIGISMLAGLTTIKPVKLAIISFILHSAAIFLLFYIGSV
jgi:hypothetical protein